MRHKDDYQRHESYGMVSLSRRHGGSCKLYGSAIKNHDNTVSLRIHRSEWTHDLSRDVYTTSSLRPIVEIEMSAAQFAEFITTMNVGSGVPCTIRSIEGKRMADIPDEENEVERVQSGFTRDMQDLAKRLKEFTDRVAELLEKPSITKADRKEILHGIFMFTQHVHSNIPFALSQFQEATEKVSNAAKAEVEAFMMHAITSAGLAAVKGKTPQEAMKGIPEPAPPGTVIKAGTLNPFRTLAEQDEE